MPTCGAGAAGDAPHYDAAADAAAAYAAAAAAPYYDAATDAAAALTAASAASAMAGAAEEEVAGLAQPAQPPQPPNQPLWSGCTVLLVPTISLHIVLYCVRSNT